MQFLDVLKGVNVMEQDEPLKKTWRIFHVCLPSSEAGPGAVSDRHIVNFSPSRFAVKPLALLRPWGISYLEHSTRVNINHIGKGVITHTQSKDG